MTTEAAADAYTISHAPAEVDIRKLQAFLTASYWAEGRSLAAVELSLDHSVVAVALRDGEMASFARCVSDRAVFGYVMDVVVWPEHQGRGLARRLVGSLIGLPELVGVKQWYLRTRDAHGVYAGLGFLPVEDDY